MDNEWIKYFEPIYDETIWEYYDSVGGYHWFAKYSGEHYIPPLYTSCNTSTTNYRIV